MVRRSGSEALDCINDDAAWQGLRTFPYKMTRLDQLSPVNLFVREARSDAVNQSKSVSLKRWLVKQENNTT